MQRNVSQLRRGWMSRGGTVCGDGRERAYAADACGPGVYEIGGDRTAGRSVHAAGARKDARGGARRCGVQRRSGGRGMRRL